jgi:hypothetical protein
MLLKHAMLRADSLAFDRAGNSMLANNQMMAMTISNSIKVNAVEGSSSPWQVTLCLRRSGFLTLFFD